MWQRLIDRWTTPRSGGPRGNPEVESQLLGEVPLRPHPDVVARRSGSDVFLVHLSQGTVFRLNATGLQVWELVQASQSLEEIVEQVSASYDVGTAAVAADVQLLLSELVKNSLVELPEGTGPCGSSLNCR